MYAGFVRIVGSDETTWNGEQPFGIGRRTASPKAGPWLDVADELASREHARISMGDAGPVVEDLHSKHGTSLNGTRLQPGKPHRLRSGDLLRIGDSFLFARHEQELADAPIPTVVGVSRAARLIRRAIIRCARNARSVLLLGETGIGKEIVAQSIHQLSQRRGKLVAVNCAALPPTLAEAHFFGTQKGAFTGATDLTGCFVEAHDGTLFLDEVGELPLDLQPKLLRVLEAREVTPLGSQRSVTVELRVLSATHRDLEHAIPEQTFRQDLYARLAAETIQLCPLRERREDTLLLAQHFAGSSWKPSPRLVSALLSFAWPLNVRQVRNVISRLGDENEDEVLAGRKTREVDLARPAPALSASAPAPESSAPNAEPSAQKPWNVGDPVPTRDLLLNCSACTAATFTRSSGSSALRVGNSGAGLKTNMDWTSRATGNREAEKGFSDLL